MFLALRLSSYGLGIRVDRFGSYRVLGYVLGFLLRSYERLGSTMVMLRIRYRKCDRGAFRCVGLRAFKGVLRSRLSSRFVHSISNREDGAFRFYNDGHYGSHCGFVYGLGLAFTYIILCYVGVSFILYRGRGLLFYLVLSVLCRGSFCLGEFL